MGWFGIGGISEDERRSIWMQHHQKNLAKEKMLNCYKCSKKTSLSSIFHSSKI